MYVLNELPLGTSHYTSDQKTIFLNLGNVNFVAQINLHMQQTTRQQSTVRRRKVRKPTHNPPPPFQIWAVVIRVQKF